MPHQTSDIRLYTQSWVNIVRGRAALNKEGDLEAALGATIMGQHHVLLAAIHEAAQAAVGTTEPM